MANRHRKAISTEKPDPTTVASVESVTAGDTDPVSDTGGGYGLQRFEISNLSVPAGTNWSSTPHVLQSLFGDWPLWSLPLYVIRLQATDPLATGDKIWAQLDTETGSTLDFCELNDSAESAWSSSLNNNSGLLVEPHQPTLSGTHISFNLWTNHALTADVTILFARAAFLAI
jgi:hypothetical protein